MDLSSMKKTVVASLVATACVVAPVTTFAAKPAEQPNVLLVIMDDLGTGQLDFALDSLDKAGVS